MECVKFVCVWLRGGELVDKKIGFGLYHHVGSRGSVGGVSLFGLQ